MMWTCFEIAVNLFQAWLILYFIKNMMNYTEKWGAADAICIGSCTIFYTLFLFFDMPPIDMFVFVIPFVYALIRSPDRWKFALFWVSNLAILFSSTIGLSTHLFTSVLEYDWSELMQAGVLRLFFVGFANLMLFLIIFSATKLKHDYQYVSWAALLSFLFVSICILVAEECIYYLQITISGNNVVYAIGYTSLLFGTWLLILLFYFLTKSTHREHKYKSEVSVYLATQHHQQEFKQIYKDFTAKQHDFKHALETLETLISQNNNLVAQEFLTEYQSKLKQSRLFMTGSVSVDALLTAKHLTMENHHISFKFTTCPLALLPMPVTDFCSIVGNLLDNAIEGVLRIDVGQSPRVISLTLARTYRVFHIICDNPCNIQSLHKNKNTWVSSKNIGTPYDFHGMGISNIQNVVAQFDGHCKFSVNRNMFHVELTLPLPEPLS